MSDMSDDWLVPGGPIIDDAGGRLRFVPPADWHRVILTLNVLPPSMNNNQIRSHWSGFQREKKLWQRELGMLLLVERVPRGFFQRAIAGAVLTFPNLHPRDSGNYTRLIDKALGDALTVSLQTPAGHRYIPDDDEARFFFTGVEFAGPGSAETAVHIYLQPKE